MTKTCICGCGQTIPEKPLHKYRPPRYIQGHQFYGTDKTIKPPTDYIPNSGLCECGCGETTTLYRQTQISMGQYAGYPRRYYQNHKARVQKKGPDHPNYKTGRYKNAHGYWMVLNPDRTGKRDIYIPEQRLVWQQTHGRYLLSNEDVHHINGDKGDNRPENLIAIPHSVHSGDHHSSPEFLETLSKANTAFHSDPERKAKWLASRARYNSDPQFQEKRREAVKKGWAKRRALTTELPSLRQM